MSALGNVESQDSLLLDITNNITVITAHLALGLCSKQPRTHRNGKLKV